MPRTMVGGKCLGWKMPQLVIRAIYSFISCIYSHWLSPLSPISQVRLICRSRISLVEFWSNPTYFHFHFRFLQGNCQRAPKMKNGLRQKKKKTKRMDRKGRKAKLFPLTERHLSRSNCQVLWWPSLENAVCHYWPSQTNRNLHGKSAIRGGWEGVVAFQLLQRRFQLQLQIFICW